MKRLLSLIIIISFSNCSPEPEKCCGTEDFRKKQDQIAAEYHSWEVSKDKLYILSDRSIDSALLLAQTMLDSVVKNPSVDHFPTDKEKLDDLHFIIGEFLYTASKFENALVEFSFSREPDFQNAKQIILEWISQIKKDTSEFKTNRPFPTRRTNYIKEWKKLNGL
ncbi:MAG TPA: hypothetical protein VF868_09155 [Bacteroidia bacterium]|jgi:hypothetical protein